MRKHGVLLLVLAACLLLLILTAYVASNNKIATYVEQEEDDRLNQVNLLNVNAFIIQMTEQIEKVKTMSDFFSASDHLGGEDHVSLLQATVNNNGLLRCAISFPGGNFITHDGKNNGNVLNDEFYIRAMAGEFSISDPRPAVVDPSKTVMLFTSPIIRDGKIIGALTYSYLCDDLSNDILPDNQQRKEKVLAIKTDGTLLIGHYADVATGNNLLTTLRACCSHEGHTPESCMQFTGDRGRWLLSPNGESDRMLVSYNRLPYNDWYMLSVLPVSTAAQTASMLIKEQQRLGFLVGGCVLFYLTVIVLLWVQGRLNTDKLTGAPSFDNFKKQAKHLIKRNPSQRYIVVKLDVRDFKLINRVYDIATGDQVIKNIANALHRTLAGSGSTFARVNADTFIMLIPFKGLGGISKMRQQFIVDFHETMGNNFTTVVDFPTGQYITTAQDAQKPNISEIFEKANFAHRAAKRGGMNAIVDYEENIERVALRNKKIEDRMASALADREFQLYLQPKYGVKNGSVVGAEALVRWSVDGQSMMYPSDFIPLFEQNGFIVKMDKYMFDKTAQKLRELIDAGCEPVPISVNFSKHHLHNEHFVEELSAIADQYGVPHRYMEVELLESVVFDNVDLIIALVDKLHKAGFTLSMDDFGSGYSSLGLLKDLAVDTVKIDRSFFTESNDAKRARIVVANILRMAQELEIHTVAEGIETAEQVEMLRDLDCDIIQGFYYAKPMPAEEFTLQSILLL